MTTFAEHTQLGRSGLSVSRVGLATGAGRLPAKEFERAFERGVNYLYWGSLRSSGFAEAVRNLVPTKRDRMVLVVQSYTRAASLMAGSLERALRKLKTDHTDLLLLGWWNQLPPARILDAAIALRDRGLARHIMISCHDRTTFKSYATNPAFDAMMLRYNAAHPGAESDVFPFLPPQASRPGLVAYTATRWGGLTDPALTPAGERVPRGSDCYQFALSRPEIDLVISAPQTTEQLDDTLATLDRGPMTDDEIAWMKRVGVAVKRATASQSKRSVVATIDRVLGALSGSGEENRT